MNGCAWQSIVFKDFPEPTLARESPPGVIAATARVAWYCRTFRSRLPPVDGELGWEEMFVGPLVTGVFHDLLAAPGGAGGRVEWTG